tara:strand:- start:12580 stop:14625 length:2046 start_codon:yes stop_codon:yes gene_type:complete
MNTDSKIIKQQLEIIINDFFMDKLINKNHNKTHVELNEYLLQNLHEIEENLGINFEKTDIREAFVELCEEYNLLPKISKNKDLSKSVILDIVDNKIVFDEKACQKITENVVNSYKDNGNIDLNKLYEPIDIEDKVEDYSELLNEEIFSYLKTTQKWQKKEAIGTINTFLEASNYSKNDVKKLINKSKRINKENYTQEFLKLLAEEINNASLISSPFQIKKNHVTFKGKGSGLYDFFMYSEKTNKFALNFSTRSRGTSIDGTSIFKHTLSALSILHSYQNNNELTDKEKLKQENVFKYLYKDWYQYKSNTDYKNKTVNPEFITENKIDKFKYQDQCIKGVNKRLPEVLSKTMKMKYLNPNCIITKNGKTTLDKEIAELAIENNKRDIETVYLEKEDIDKLFETLNFDLNVFYFGEVSSNSMSNKNTYSENFTDEELRAGINILAYSGKNISGIGGVNMSPKAALRLLEKINYRFNTSTRSNEKCLNIEKLNSNIRNIGGVFIEKFMLTEDPISLIENTYETESNQILENMAFFEKNILSQIIDGITKDNLSPTQAYALTLGEFNLKPKLSFENFIKNIKTKWDVISDERLDNGNSSMIKHIEEMIEKQKAYLKLEEMMLMNLDMLLHTQKEEDAINQFISMAEKMDVEPLNILSKKIDESIIKQYRKDLFNNDKQKILNKNT